MNQFMQITKNALNRHGRLSEYTVVTSAYDIETGSTVKVKTPYDVLLYKKHIKANQYFYPTLIDKDIAMFYLCADGLVFTPNAQDEIEYSGKLYTVDSYDAHEAQGEVILYRIIGVTQ